MRPKGGTNMAQAENHHRPRTVHRIAVRGEVSQIRDRPRQLGRKSLPTIKHPLVFLTALPIASAK